jgi:hypothetical protein
MSEHDDWASLRPIDSVEIDRVQARTRELLESLGLEALFMAIPNRWDWVKDMSAEELLENLLGKAYLETGGGRLLALVAIRRESGGGFAGLLVSAQRPGHVSNHG